MKTKRIVALLLALVLTISVISVSGFAEEDEGIKPYTYHNLGDYTTTPLTAVSVTSKIEDRDLLINQEVAEKIAELFINDMISSGHAKWDSGTHITGTKTLYDEDGASITGYSIELNSGYVVVSAYIDVPNVILEWADEAEPLYDDAHWDKNAKIIYTGPMGYFLDTGTSSLRSFDGEVVARRQVQNQIAPLRDVKNVQVNVLQSIVAEKQAAQNNGKVAMARASDNHAGGYITDAGVYAKNVYGGNWTCTGWCNPWEQYANFAVTSDFSGYTSHCGPTAITNAIKMYGNKYNNNYIKSLSNGAVFNKVIEANQDAGGKYYVSEKNKGTKDETANDFIKAAFRKHGVNVSTYGVDGAYDCNLENLKNAVTPDRLMYIMLHRYGTTITTDTNNWRPYGDHAVIGYAWSCMTRDGGLVDKYFVKICDGHYRSGRYLDLSLLEGDWRGNKYWEIKF